MSLLSDLTRTARTALLSAKSRYETAGTMERHRLKAVIKERRRLLYVLNLLRRAHELGHDIFDRRKGTTRLRDIALLDDTAPGTRKH